MRDDDRIIRDVEKIPEQTHREGRMAILERELGLAPLPGVTAIAGAAREARIRIMGELSANWRRMYADRSGMKPGLWGALKRRDAEFWLQHSDSTPKEVFLSELFELKPIAGDSPLMADARLARYRLLWELLGLRLKEHNNHEAVKMIWQVLSRESPQFWYEHMNFSAEELIKLRFPDIQYWVTPSERASYIFMGVLYLAGIAVVFSLDFVRDSFFGRAFVVIMIMKAFEYFISAKRNRKWYWKELNRKAKK